MAEAETTTPAEENTSTPAGSGLSATVNAAAKADEKPAETTAQTPPEDTPVETPAETAEQAKKRRTSEKFKAAAEAKRQEELELINQKKEGGHAYFYDDNGNRVITGEEQYGDIGDVLNSFVQMLFQIFSQEGREYLAMISHNENLDTYVDEVERASRAADQANVNANDPNSKTPINILTPESHLTINETQNALQALSRLENLIIANESSGDANVIYDYRSQLPAFAGKNYNGLQPGDTTAGGLVVPDITTLSVGEVIEWQKKYIREQRDYHDRDFPDGIPISLAADKSEENKQRLKSTSDRAQGIYRSSAVGRYQFTYSRLEQLGIDKNMKFDENGQRLIARASMWDLIKHESSKEQYKNASAEEISEGVTKRLMTEWEGLKNVDPNALQKITADLLRNASQVDELKIAHNQSTGSNTPSV